VNGHQLHEALSQIGGSGGGGATDPQTGMNTTNIANLQGDVGNLQGTVRNVQRDVTQIQGDITTIQGDVTTLQSDVLTIQGDVADNSIEIVANRADIDANTNAIAGISTGVSDLSDRVTLNEEANDRQDMHITTNTEAIAANVGRMWTLRPIEKPL